VYQALALVGDLSIVFPAKGVDDYVTKISFLGDLDYIIDGYFCRPFEPFEMTKDFVYSLIWLVGFILLSALLQWIRSRREKDICSNQA